MGPVNSAQDPLTAPVPMLKMLKRSLSAVFKQVLIVTLFFKKIIKIKKLLSLSTEAKICFTKTLTVILFKETDKNK